MRWSPGNVAILFIIVSVVGAEEESFSRFKRQTSSVGPVSYECLTSNNVGGVCIHYSQCPEHSAKSTNELHVHRCFGYRKASQLPIVCCTSPQSSDTSQHVDDSASPLSSRRSHLRDVSGANSELSSALPLSSDVSLQSSGARAQSSCTSQLSSGARAQSSCASQLSSGTIPQLSGNSPQFGGTVTPASMRSRGRFQPDSDDLLNHPNARLLPTESCGGHAKGSMFTGRTYGGNTTQIGEFPWTVLLKYRIGNKENFLCGGALIGDRYVLTAAHCVLMDAQLISVRIGEHDQSTDPDCSDSEESICAPRVQDIPVMRTVTPVEYDKSNRNHYYDIAVVILRNTTQFNDYVQPICLPFGEMGQRDLTNRRLWIAGWGTRMGKDIRVKIGVDVRGGKHAECSAEYQGGHISISRDKQICAVDRDSCKSDSGGALMNFRGTTRGDVWYLHGISSFGPTPCTVAGMSEVYTRVSYYLNWILRSLSAGTE